MESIPVTLVRSGSMQQTATVQFQTASGTATEGVDFVGPNGVATFQPDEWYKVILISLLNDGLVEGGRGLRAPGRQRDVVVLGNGGGSVVVQPDAGFITRFVVPDRGVFPLQLIVWPGATYVLEGSSNLMDWRPLQTNVALSGQLEFAAPMVSPEPVAQFFRAYLLEP